MGTNGVILLTVLGVFVLYVLFHFTVYVFAAVGAFTVTKAVVSLFNRKGI